MTQKRFKLRLFGVSSIRAFFETIDSCRDTVYLEFDGTLCSLNEDESLRKMLLNMAVNDRLDAALPISVSERDLNRMFGFMNRKVGNAGIAWRSGNEGKAAKLQTVVTAL